MGSQITIANDPVTISSIAVRVDLAAASNLKLVIFSHPDHEVVYVSEPKLFTDDGMSWKKSNTLDVVLPPGTYDISAIGLVGGVWQYDEAPASSGTTPRKCRTPISWATLHRPW